MVFMKERRGALWYNSQGEIAGITIIGGMFAAPLKRGEQQRTSVTCTNANQDYTNPPPAYALYAVVTCSAECVVASEEATSPTIGVIIPAGIQITVPIILGMPGGDGLLHVQSP